MFIRKKVLVVKEMYNHFLGKVDISMQKCATPRIIYVFVYILKEIKISPFA